jgi:hypothetical protein
LLDHLHDAANSASSALPLMAWHQTQHAGAHAVDELARRVVQVAEELGLGQRHAQHRHLQARKPDAHRGRYAVFAEDALEHQGHHLDDGLLAGRAGLFLNSSARSRTPWATRTTAWGL